MLDREAMPLGDAAEDWLQDRLVEVVDLLAARTDQVVVMRGLAGDVRRDVAVPLEPPGHAALDLRFQGAVDRRERQAWIARSQALVELLGRHRLTASGQRLGHDQTLVGETPSP